MSEDILLNLKKRNLMAFVFVLLVLVLVLPTFLRFFRGNDALIGSESYYHYRAAGEILNSGSWNPFNPPSEVHDYTYTSRMFFFNPYHYILAYSSKIVSLSTASRVVPFILGILAVLLFSLILKRFVAEKHQRHIILLLLVLNPAFIYTFTVSNPHAAAIVLTLLGFYFFLKDGTLSLISSVVCFVLVSFFSLFNTALVVLVLIAYIISKNDRQSRFIVVVFLLAMFSLAKRASFFYNYTYIPDMNILGNLFSDLGSIIGFGVFTVVLAVYGIMSGWKEKSRFIYFLVLGVLLLVALFFTGNVANMYLVFFVSIAAGVGLVMLYESKWSVILVKKLTLLIICCGLLFSAASFMNRLEVMEPSSSIVESLRWLQDNTFKDSFVLSHYAEGYMIATVGHNPVLADSLATSNYDQRFAYKLQDSIFYSRNLNNVKHLFDVYNIKYIYLTPEMKSGLVWTKPDEGLRFLLTSPSTFRQIYSKDGIEVWEVMNTTV